MKKAATIFAAAGIAAFGVAACGSSSSDNSSSSSSDSTSSSTAATTGGAGSTVKISTDPSGQLKFTTGDVTAPAGSDTIELDNQSPVSHDLVVQDSGGQEVGRAPITSQGTNSFSADLKPGTYKYFCDLPGHEATMHGTITVK